MNRITVTVDTFSYLGDPTGEYSFVTDETATAGAVLAHLECIAAPCGNLRLQRGEHAPVYTPAQEFLA